MKKNKLKELQYHNNKLDEMIKEENQAIFTDIVCYIKIADISEYNREIVRRDISEMIIEAQNRGENIDDVIGGDYKEFCDSIIESLPKRTAKERIIEFFDIVCLSLSVFSVINIFLSTDTWKMAADFIKGAKPNLTMEISYGFFVSTAVIVIVAYMIIRYICMNVFVEKKEPGKMTSALYGVFVGLALVLFSIIVDHILKGAVFTVNIFLFAAFAAVLYVVHITLERI